MQENELSIQSKMHRAVSDIVVAEMFLVQATIESLNAIGDGISDLGKQFYWDSEDTPPQEPIKNVLQRTRDDVVESYTSRFNYLRKLIDSDS
jgi:hypothetical protein